jgi:hypothetical protein
MKEARRFKGIFVWLYIRDKSNNNVLIIEEYAVDIDNLDSKKMIMSLFEDRETSAISHLFYSILIRV